MKYEVIEVPIEDIFFDRDFNCRSFSIESTAPLAKSIEAHGLLTPIILQPYDGPYEYRIVAGHRRYTAMRYHLRRKKIPAFICEAGAEANLAENLDRQDLNILEQAKAIRRLYPDGSIRSIAKAMNRNVVWVEIRLRLLRLSGEIQQMAACGKLNTTQLLQVIRYRGSRVKYARELAAGKKSVSKRRPTCTQIREMLRTLTEQGFNEDALRLGLWVVGDISKEEIFKKPEN